MAGLILAQSMDLLAVTDTAAGSMRRRLFAASAALAVVAAAGGAAAVPLTPFRYEEQAQRHCPGDTIVWLDFRTRRYYSSGQKRYARGFDGSFVCREEARRSGYRRSLLGLR
jgi:hypothetical protein